MTPKNRTLHLALVVSMIAFFVSFDLEGNIQVFRVDEQQEPPTWALYERQLIDTLNRAGIEFYNTYVLEDGSL